MINQSLSPIALAIAGLSLCLTCGCSRSGPTSSVEASTRTAEANQPGRTKAEPKSPEASSVEPQVQSDIEKTEAEKRATLLKDAETALEQTHDAITALSRGDTKAALAALEQATGKLDLVVSRDPKLAMAPVAVTTTVYDLYANPDTVKAAVRNAKDDLASERVQNARHLVTYLASEADVNVTEIPLATYRTALISVAPLIDSGKTQDAEAALEAALNTLVIETIVVPLPAARAEALLNRASQIAAKSNRSQDDKTRLHNLIEATRTQLQLAEALGYGTKDTYKPLYGEIDDVQKKAESGQSGGNLFDKVRQSIHNFKFSV